MRFISRSSILTFGAILVTLIAKYAWALGETKAEVAIRHIHMTFQVCRAIEPGFEIRNAPIYEAWLRRNRETVLRFSEKPWYLNEVNEFIKQEAGRPRRVISCERLLELMDPSNEVTNK